MNKMSPICWVAAVLVIIGGLNWGLIGLFRFDLVAAIFGDMSALSRIVYTVVGIAAVYQIVALCMNCKCKEQPQQSNAPSENTTSV